MKEFIEIIPTAKEGVAAKTDKNKAVADTAKIIQAVTGKAPDPLNPVNPFDVTGLDAKAQADRLVVIKASTALPLRKHVCHHDKIPPRPCTWEAI